MAAPELRGDEVGQTVAGRYAIRRLLGHGGTASVYEAYDQRLGRSVALKRSSHRAQSRRAATLEREFNTLSQLAHPSIIEVYDFGIDDGGPYYTMELLDGQDLHEQGPLPWREVCALLRDVASSLALLHARSLIHRDVSARNVRRTKSGQAKLIDFGAMTAFGVTRDVLGTPPFLAPEALQLQALDGRADLYALGALGYYLLSGVHAYPARKLRELRDTWRSRPAPVTRYQADVPPGLQDLIMQLLSLDRAARPFAAAEVMQRLCAIADLPVTEDALVSRAYLTTPALLGRDAALVTIRRRMLELGRGRGVGGTLLIEGAPGSGRSRLLDACAFESKLVGACVLRAQAAHDRASWSVARVLVRQLVQLQPEAAEASARLSRDVLAQVLEEEPPPPAAGDAPPAATRSVLLRELRNFILAMARAQRLVILVDDADRIDDASAALLAALAYKTRRHPLVIALSIAHDDDEDTSGSLRFLRMVAERILVDPLVADQTEALLRSVFGDVPGMQLAAGLIHTLAQGNPAQILEFAQHLVDKGFARYEAGTWSLPRVLSERDLPASLSTRLAARLAGLSSDAFEICEALCIADADSEIVGVAQFAQLTSHGDSQRVLAALDELVLAHVLMPAAERHRFSQRAFVPVVDALIGQARRHQLHSRLADMLRNCEGDSLRRVEHLMTCGREREALDAFDPARSYERAVTLRLIERMLAAAVENKLPARRVHALRSALVRRAALDLARDEYLQHAPQLFDELERTAGLARYREHADLPPGERLKAALSETHEIYNATPEAERLLPFPEAIRSLAVFCAVSRVMALATFDRECLDAIPSLAAFEGLSPTIGVLEETARINQLSIRGRFQLACDGYERLLTEMEDREKSGQTLPEYSRARFSVHYVLGMLDAGRGRESAEKHAAACARDRSYRVNAWRVRALLNLARGDLQEAANCRRRAELALLREGVAQQYPETTAFSELQCYALCDDLNGVRQATERISELASRFEGWRQFLVLGQAHELRLLGDPEGALARLEPMLRAVQPGVHAGYACLAACHLQLLCDAGRVAEAAKIAATYVEVCDREQLSPAGLVTHVAAANAFARNLEFGKAVQLLDRAIAAGRDLGHGGVCVGSMYEARARLALAMEDTPQFEHYTKLCAAAYGGDTNPHLALKLARLRDAQPKGEPNAMQQVAPANDARARDEYVTLHSRMLECADETERARCALTVLLQHLTSYTGYLFGVNEGECTLLARHPDHDVEIGLEVWTRRLVEEALKIKDEATSDLDMSTDTEGDTNTDALPSRYVDEAGRTFDPLFLVRRSGGEERMAAVLIFEAAGRGRPSREVMEELADQLLTHGDVRGAPMPVDDAFTR